MCVYDCLRCDDADHDVSAAVLHLLRIPNFGLTHQRFSDTQTPQVLFLNDRGLKVFYLQPVDDHDMSIMVPAVQERVPLVELSGECSVYFRYVRIPGQMCGAGWVRSAVWFVGLTAKRFKPTTATTRRHKMKNSCRSWFLSILCAPDASGFDFF
jgi:hypothetical protein